MGGKDEEDLPEACLGGQTGASNPDWAVKGVRPVSGDRLPGRRAFPDGSDTLTASVEEYTMCGAMTQTKRGLFAKEILC